MALSLPHILVAGSMERVFFRFLPMEISIVPILEKFGRVPFIGPIVHAGDTAGTGPRGRLATFVSMMFSVFRQGFDPLYSGKVGARSWPVFSH
jgi:hypothetical protein